jgi:ABC-type polysaccharide/polyol phosphate export permease
VVLLGTDRYPMQLVQDQLGTSGWKITVYNLNPLVRFVEAFRDVFYDLRFPPPITSCTC